jgi:hypothetical protein
MRCPCVNRPVQLLVKQCLYDVMIDGAVGGLVLPAVPDIADRAAGDRDGQDLGFGRRSKGWRALPPHRRPVQHHRHKDGAQ